MIWSRRARQDLAAIFRFIARDNRAAAEHWVARLERAYRVVYRVDGEDVRILTVIEGHRLLDPETLGMNP